MSRTNPTKLNGSAIDIDAPVELEHKDMFTIGDRHFRWEFPEGSPYHVKKTTEDSGVQEESNPDLEGVKILTPKVKAPIPMEMPISKRLAELEAEGTPSKRKRVSFGQYISPELFDKDLPPDTPVRKGAVPPSELKGLTEHLAFTIFNNFLFSRSFS